jgi:hypothetical protein
MGKIELDKLYELVEKGYLTTQKHPLVDLHIFNYSQKAQYSGYWDEYTIISRGLITDSYGNIVARPFKKFFNLEEHNEPIKSSIEEITEKMDGSLGILFFIDNKPYLATRGSFSSEQAIKGTEILHKKYSHINFQKHITYLFEIIYPQNRIVVDYQEREDLILLAMIETKTGKDLPLLDIGTPLVKRYENTIDINTLKNLEEKNREGFVVRFNDGLRLKVKFKEYVRLHRVLTRINAVDIWEYLKDKKDFNELLDKVPDEFYKWVHKTVDKLNFDYKKIEETAKSEYKELIDRKSTAEYFKKCSYPAIMFKILDNRDYSEFIWKLIKPKAEKPFRDDI